MGADPLRELPDKLQRITSDLAMFAVDHPDLTCLLMIDPLLDGFIIDTLRQQTGGTIQPHAVPCPVLKNEPALCPQLFELQADRHADVIEYAIRYALFEQNAQQRLLSASLSVCGILFSRVNVAETARHLALQTDVFNPNNGERSFLSFFDRRVLPTLPDIFDTAQWNQLLGPIDYWFVIDRYDEWQRFEHVPFKNLNSEQAAVHNALLAPLRFTPAQWEKLEQIQWTNQLADLWLEGSDALPGDFMHRTDRLFKKARQHGMTEKKDCVIFALHGLRLGPGFDSHPVFGTVLKAVAQGASYARESDKIIDTDWQAAKAQLQAHQ